VTLLHDIQRAAAADEVPVSTVLLQAQILASRLNHTPLADWASHELGGYPNLDELPDYRRCGEASVRGEFMTVGGILSNVPIAASDVPAEILGVVYQALFSLDLPAPVSAYESVLVSGEQVFGLAWSDREVALIRPVLTTLPGGQLSSAARQLPASAIAALFVAVRTRLLRFTLEIERANPAAGEGPAGDEPLPLATVTQIFNNTIYGGQNVITAAAADANVAAVQLADIDWDALHDRLAALGIPDDDLDALQVAIANDQAGPGSVAPGPATELWLGRVSSKVALGGLVLAKAATMDLVTHEVLRALGLA
jgi:AbiTii